MLLLCHALDLRIPTQPLDVRGLLAHGYAGLPADESAAAPGPGACQQPGNIAATTRHAPSGSGRNSATPLLGTAPMAGLMNAAPSNNASQVIGAEVAGADLGGGRPEQHLPPGAEQRVSRGCDCDCAAADQHQLPGGQAA